MVYRKGVMAETERDRGFIPGLVIVALLLCVGCPAWVAYRMWADPRTKAGMTEAATAYLDAWRDADYATAYRWVCAEERAKTPPDTWARYHTAPDIESYRITDVVIEDRTEAPTGYYVDAELTYAEGTVQLWHFVLYDESDGWRICYETAITRRG
ncbi:hypothetical protein [Catellatospora sp. NPDC049609]|uniref:Rv0361 family membrane protein n=1 Tax=Catellatospora sp. NPDC049609 TaxID=3155505 RepID=UPI003412CFA6